MRRCAENALRDPHSNSGSLFDIDRIKSMFDPGSKQYLEFKEKYHEDIEDFKSICGVR